MPLFLKAFVVVIVVTTFTFWLAKPLMRRFMSDADFSTRRNVWLGLTAAAFLIPQYWAYVAVAILVLAYGLRRDSNPAALYIFLLLAIVPIGLPLPTFGLVRQIFLLDHLRLLSLVVLAPAAWRLARSASAVDRHGGLVRERSRLHVDLLVLCYLALQIVLLTPFESVTASLRRIVLVGIDVWLPYYVLSRSCRSRETLIETMAAFAMAMFVLAPLAVFESVKGWLLYASLQDQWGTAAIINYLRRGNLLRAQLTSGHSIVLGYAMTIAFGFWLYLQHRVEPLGWRLLAIATLVVGIVMPFARGPWLGSGVVLVVFLALGPNRGGRLLKLLVIAAPIAITALLSPYGDRIIERLPFVGTLEQGSIDYRQQLASTAWLLVQQNPWFGTPGYLAYLEDLRQGQGIIDIVNAYASIALGYGLLTLVAFVGAFTLVTIRCVLRVRDLSSTDPDLALLGASLVACMVAALLMLATVNLYLSVGSLTWALLGLGAGYVRITLAKVVESQAGPDVALNASAGWSSRMYS
jgi:hypothetical protein